MRGTVPLRELVVQGSNGFAADDFPVPPHAIGAQLPALYQDDVFAQRFVAGLDPVMATGE